ncbi:MAG: SCO family protein [Flavisolibacter sp.]|jgi:protein SCO1/2
MSRKRIFYVVFFSVLVLGFFVTLASIVPGFTKPKFAPIGIVQPFSFINQDGRVFTDKDIKGKVLAVNYFFTSCRAVCPRMNNNLRPVYDAFRNEPDFLILSHTSDPGRDSASRLKHYADSMNVDTRKWIFLTGRKDSLYSMARHSYQIDDPKNYVQNIDDDFLHTQFIALVNRKGEVVKIYDGIKPSEMSQMQMEIKKLLKE